MSPPVKGKHMEAEAQEGLEADETLVRGRQAWQQPWASYGSVPAFRLFRPRCLPPCVPSPQIYSEQEAPWLKQPARIRLKHCVEVGALEAGAAVRVWR